MEWLEKCYSFAFVWGFWLFYFVLFEAIALYRDDGQTFSHYVWHAMDSKPVVVWIVACTLIWALVHFLSRGRFA